MKLKNNLIVLLPVMAAAVAAVMAVSCEKDANWKPTWALPLVKEQTILIEKFIDDKTVKEVNDKVRVLWGDYVTKHLTAGISLDSANVIDSIAYLVLVNNKDSTYVTFEDGTPKLNDSI
ncbi:MAG: hypothetical protein LBH84_05920, partial [Prevotellaceae bacterium]|nr:hypothetical protein [Prevotellaceae bacterium]